ncbi:MAG: Arm DNA-binding domain-containing protein, partial [Bacteroidota bacterium]|nr:Arm DNA-binding domain-containing protein [Bacteroidota bacterium]
MQTSFNLLFYLKKSKHYTAGPITIYARITINSQRAEFSTGRECNPERWNSSAGYSMGTKEDSKALNSYLDTIQAKIYYAHRKLLECGGLITA